MKKSGIKSRKKVYSYVEELMCPRCKCRTLHSLFDMEKGIYRCNICHTVHAKSKLF